VTKRSARMGRAASPITLILLLALGAIPWSGCSSSDRRLDPVYSSEKYSLELKFRYQPGLTDPGILKRFQPGDILTFSLDESSFAVGSALSDGFSQVGQVGIIFPLHDKLRVLSADSERGTYVDTMENHLKGRGFYVLSYPPGLLDFDRLNQFAARATFLARMDYDWSAAFGIHSNLTPNTLPDVGDEYTDATVVGAALHFSGLSLDRAWKGVVTAADIVHSVARRNLNGPAVPGRSEGNGRKKDREVEVWEELR
jgi:hypothetical protein